MKLFSNSSLLPKIRLLLLSGLSAILVAGCVSLGKDFDEGMVSSFKVDVTTKTQIQELLGDPWRVGMENGQTVWTYGAYKYGLFKKAYAKDLVLRFDNKGKLKSYLFNSTDLSESL